MKKHKKKAGLPALAVSRKHVPAVVKAIKALAVMEKELDSAKTYESIRRVERAAEALKVLHGEVDDVRQKAEWVILLARQRIGVELEKVPKAASGRQAVSLTARGKSNHGRAATGISGTTRSRVKKLKGYSKSQLFRMADALWRTGKEATLTAVLRVHKESEIKAERRAYELRADRGAKLGDLVAMAETGQRFNVLCADPPWTFKVYSGKGKQRSAERYYDTSSLEAIKALPIAPLAAADCALFLWSVWPELPGALEVIKAWGFEYKTAGFVWAKTVSATNADWFTGMGYHTRANTEPCLLATRGSPHRMAKDVHQLVVAPVGAHSEKPDEVYARVTRLFNGPYLELFGRKPRPGWTVWGNELAPALSEAAE